MATYKKRGAKKSIAVNKEAVAEVESTTAEVFETLDTTVAGCNLNKKSSSRFSKKSFNKSKLIPEANIKSDWSSLKVGI